MAKEDEFGHRYERGGFNYDREKMEVWLAQHAPTLTEGEGRPLVDIGCGDGFWTRILLDWGWDVTGIDPCKSGIRVAREKDSRATYICEDVFADHYGMYDTVFCRHLSLMNFRINEVFRGRLQHMWSMAERQMIWSVYSKKPYGVRVPDSKEMFYNDPDKLHAEACQLAEDVKWVKTNNYFTWTITRG